MNLNSPDTSETTPGQPESFHGIAERLLRANEPSVVIKIMRDQGIDDGTITNALRITFNHQSTAAFEEARTIAATVQQKLAEAFEKAA